MFEPMFDHCCRDLSNLVLLGLRKELKRDLLLVARVQRAQRLVGSCRIMSDPPMVGGLGFEAQDSHYSVPQTTNILLHHMCTIYGFHQGYYSNILVTYIVTSSN